MATDTSNAADAAQKEDFAALLEESFGDGDMSEGSVIKGTVLSIDGDNVLIDVGLKSEGRIPLKEFGVPGQAAEIEVGDVVDVYLERMENRNGEAVLSREGRVEKRPGRSLKLPLKKQSASPELFSAGLKAVLPSILPAPLPFSPVARLMYAQFAMSAQ